MFFLMFERNDNDLEVGGELDEFSASSSKQWVTFSMTSWKLKAWH